MLFSLCFCQSCWGTKFQDRPNPWIHFGLEKILMLCGPVSLKKLSLDYICQLPFTDLLLNKIGSHCPLLEDFSLTATNYFSSDSAVRTLNLNFSHRVFDFPCIFHEAFTVKRTCSFFFFFFLFLERNFRYLGLHEFSYVPFPL